MVARRWGLGCAALLAALATGCGDDAPADEDTPLPSAPIEVVIDDNGVPHIYAQTDRDVFYGAGYMQGVHRMLQVDMARRRALGRWAEVLGEEKLADDKIARYFNWRDAGRAASSATRQQNPEEWGIITAWVEGLNRRIEEVLAGDAPLPYGFGPDELDYLPERWEPDDVLVVAKMTGFGNDLSLEYEVFTTLAERIKPDVVGKVEVPRPAHAVTALAPEDLPAGAPGTQGTASAPPAGTQSSAAPAPDFSQASWDLWEALGRMKSRGSNNWVVDGRFTENGRPMLCGDPHLGFDFPGMFYALHLDSAEAGGKFNVAGFSFPGLPGVSIGHTAAVAWTPTTAFADVMDVWDVPAPAFDQLEVAGQATPLTLREETIIVRRPGSPAGEGDEVLLTARDVPGLGVVVPSEVTGIPAASPGRELVLGWTGYRVGPSELTGLNSAKSADEFDAAVDRQSGLNFNMVAADAGGITYRVGIRVPKRDLSNGQRPWLILDGSDPSTLWTDEVLAPEQIPHGRAPGRGWIATANNDPFGFTFNGRLDDDPWYYGAFFAPAWRAYRLNTELERLTAQGNLTLEDMRSLQNDLTDVLGRDLMPMLGEAWSRVGTDPALDEFAGRADLASVAQLLTQDWDGRMARDSAGAVAFTLYSNFLTSAAVEDDMGSLFTQVRSLQAIFLFKFVLLTLRGDYPEGDALLQEGRDVVLLRALERTADYLTQRFGGVDPTLYRYGDLHVSSFEDSLGSGLDFGSHPSDGGEATVNVSPTNVYDSSNEIGETWTSRYGPILRHCEQFAEDGTPEMHFNFPLGNIADPESPHFSDLMDLWLDGGYRRMWFKRADVEAHAEERLTIEP